MRRNFISKTPYIPYDQLQFERLIITDISNQTNSNVAKCLLCNQILKNIGYKRLLGHRNICNNEKNKVKSKKKVDQNITSQSVAESLLQNASILEVSTTRANENTDLEEIDESLGMFFFGCGIPFSTVESKHFINFVKKLNPDYKLPSRRTLSGKLLDKVHEKIIKKTSFSESTESVLLVDGWKNSSKNEKYLVATIHNADGTRLFLNSWDFTQESETALNLKKVIEEASKEAKEKYNANIYAVVSDNVSSMISMGNMINEWHRTCDSHSGNLLAKNLVDSSFNLKVVNVLKVFKLASVERELTHLGGSRIVLPGETRWCSYRDAYRCFLRNLINMRSIVRDKRMMSHFTTQVIDLVLDEEFEREVLKFTIIFDGICELINKCQKADFNIADALEEWLKLEFPIHNQEMESALKYRLDKVVKPINLAANVLHHVYQGKRFSENRSYNQIARKFLEHNLDENGLKSLSDYERKSGIFNTLFQIESKCPYTFWTFAEHHHPELAKLAQKLLRIPSSTAAIERLFSQWALIHNKLRNRLSQEKSKKLIHCYYTLKLDDFDFNDDFY